MKIMRRIMHTSNSKPFISTDYSKDNCPIVSTEDFRPTHKNGILCASSKKRMYFLIILTGVALLWVCIYYKLLNHRFELPEPFRELRRYFGDGPSKSRNFRGDETENVIDTTFHLPIVLNIAIVACKSRIDEALINLKAITLVTNFSLNFHIFTDKKNYERQTFGKVLNTWPAYTQRWMMYYTYPVIYPDIVLERQREEWENLFKPCASLRLFLAKKLINVDSVLYVDTDIIFLQPPEDLWKHFESFTPHQIAGLASECEKGQEHCWYGEHAKHPYVEPYGVNTGVMLMNLTRMRKKNWEEDLIEIYTNNKRKLTFGDQDILNIYFNEHPKSLFTFSCVWNYRPDFCMKGNVCEDAVTHGVSALHGNRLSFQKNKVQPEFKVVYDAYKYYNFDDNFHEKIVNTTKIVFRKKYSWTECGKMLDPFLKHIKDI